MEALLPQHHELEVARLGAPTPVRTTPNGQGRGCAGPDEPCYPSLTGMWPVASFKYPHEMKRVPHPNIHTKRGGGKGGRVRGGGRCVVDKWTTNYGRAVRIREIGSPISDRSTDAVVTDESGAVAVVGAVSGSEGGFLGRICTRTRLSDGLAGAVPGYGLDRQWRRGRSRPTSRAGGPRTRGCVGPSTAALSSSTLVAGQCRPVVNIRCTGVGRAGHSRIGVLRNEVWEGSGGMRVAARRRAGESWRSCGAR